MIVTLYKKLQSLFSISESDSSTTTKVVAAEPQQAPVTTPSSAYSPTSDLPVTNEPVGKFDDLESNTGNDGVNASSSDASTQREDSGGWLHSWGLTGVAGAVHKTVILSKY